MKKIILLLAIINIGFYSCKEQEISLNEKELLEKVREKTKTNNKYIYFNVWATSCIPCIKEMPDLDSLALLYKDKVDFIFLTKETNEKIERFFKTKDIQLKHSIFMNDEEKTIAYLSEKIGKKGLPYPTHIIMNDELEIIHHYTGSITSYAKGRSVFDLRLTKALKNLK